MLHAPVRWVAAFDLEIPAPGCGAPEFVIDERKQLIRGVGITPFNGGQAHSGFAHVPA